MDIFITAFLSLLVGTLAGYLFKREDLKRKKLELDAENERNIRQSEKKVHESEKKAQTILNDAKDEVHEIVSKAKDKAFAKIQELEKREIKLEQKENNLTDNVKKVEKQKISLQEEKEKLDEKIEELDEKTEKLDEKIKEVGVRLEKVSGMTKDEAKELLLKKVELVFEKDIINKMKRAEENLKDSLEEKAKDTIVHAIQKLSVDTSAESTVTVVNIPNDEMKGRVIGREGRNINTFERFTGIDVIVDDTPNVITISGYDLLRRFIAKKSLEKLIEDGRIHPTRIEEVVTKVTEQVDKMVKDFGEKAIFDVGIVGLPMEIVKILGRLRFRTSYGQNVLKHSIEVAYLAEAIASEVGADSELAKKAGLLHDIGKAVSQQVAGKHAIIGSEICRKFKLDPRIINAVEAHHEDVEFSCPESFIVAAADAISASRPGARRETMEAFIKRVKELENIGASCDGVKKCYAIQAGREIRIIVDPKEIGDLQAKKLSWDVARKIEGDMSFPGEIKVLVLREIRNEEIAR